MKNNVLIYILDIQSAVVAINLFVGNQSYERYAFSFFLPSAVERKIEIMGEALSKMKKENPEYLEKIRCHREFISLRNILIHGYGFSDSRIVWSLIQESLDNLYTDTFRIISMMEE